MARSKAAVLTGEGPGAVAVVRVWGEDAIEIADAAFRPNEGRGLSETRPGRPRVGRIGAGLGDEVVAVVAAREPPEVEIQCHGGPAAIALVVDELVKSGARMSSAMRWVWRQAGSRTRAEALLDLPGATTLRSASHLLDQAEGALDQELRSVLEDDPGRALARIDGLLASASVGLRLVSGWRVVLAGRPNVGQSRLLNALVGFDRAIVDPSPGTTRDVVVARSAFDGWPVELADTAGLRATDDPIEKVGVALARSRQRSADIVVLVLDRSVNLTDDDRRLLAEHPDALRVANKSDLPAAWDADGLVVSAEFGDGIDRLAAQIGRRLVPDPPRPASALLFRPRQVRRLELIRSAIVVGGDRARAIRSLRRWLGLPER
jgi:tRNA modification GTPase